MTRTLDAMASHLATGAEGEEAAVRYLKKQRYTIRGRNVRFGKDEIDIVAFDKRERMIVFAEVKTRTRTHADYPIRTAVDARKQRCLRRAIGAWIREHDYDGPARTDIICVSQGRIVEHIRDVGSMFP